MTETKFTPGPWDQGDLLIGKMVDDRKRYTSIAMIHDSEEGYEGEDKANEHLIAAAPDLYEALYRLTRDCEVAELQKQAGFDCWIIMANAALAKARGEIE